jgi:hypothetical protein
MSFLDEDKVYNLTKGDNKYTLHFYKLLDELLGKSIGGLNQVETINEINTIFLKRNIHKLKPNIQLFCHSSVYEYFITFEEKIKRIEISHDEVLNIKVLLSKIQLELQNKINKLSINT